MATYINREALIKQVKAIHKAVDTSDSNIAYDTGFHSATSQIQGLIAWMPAADVVKVVRCKDCKHFKPQNISAHWHSTERYCMRKVAIKVNEDDFCSYGEKKDGKDGLQC